MGFDPLWQGVLLVSTCKRPSSPRPSGSHCSISGASLTRKSPPDRYVQAIFRCRYPRSSRHFSPSSSQNCRHRCLANSYCVVFLAVQVTFTRFLKLATAIWPSTWSKLHSRDIGSQSPAPKPALRGAPAPLPPSHENRVTATKPLRLFMSLPFRLGRLQSSIVRGKCRVAPLRFQYRGNRSFGSHKSPDVNPARAIATAAKATRGGKTVPLPRRPSLMPGQTLGRPQTRRNREICGPWRRNPDDPMIRSP